MGKSITDFPPNPASFPPIHPTSTRASDQKLFSSRIADIPAESCSSMPCVHWYFGSASWPASSPLFLAQLCLQQLAQVLAGAPQQPAGPGAVQVSGRDAVPIPPAGQALSPALVASLSWSPCVLPVDNERWHRWLPGVTAPNREWSDSFRWWHV